MKLYILNSNYEMIGLIDQAESILWNKKFNDIGECEIYVPSTNDYIALLQEGYYVYRYDDDMFCKIQTVEIKTDIENGDYIIATAQSMVIVLSGRIVRWPIVFSGTVPNFIKQLLVDNVISPAQSQRAISNFIIDESNFSSITETIDASVQCDDLLKLITETCKTYSLGFKVSFNINTSKLVFSLYKGENKATTQSDEYVEFSPTYANIISSDYKEDSSNYKNIAYVGYKNSNDEFTLLSVLGTTSEAANENRKEFYVDATSTSREITEEELLQMFPNAVLQDNTYTIRGLHSIIFTVATVDGDKIIVTDYTYLKMIRRIGKNALNEYVRTQSFTGEVDTINTYEYKVDYDIGDIVKVINEYGISANAQITEIMESEDTDNGYSVEPKFEYFN